MVNRRSLCVTPHAPDTEPSLSGGEEVKCLQRFTLMVEIHHSNVRAR